MSSGNPFARIAVIGAGLIGTSWASVFAAAGRKVVIYDADEAQRTSALHRVADNLRELRDAGALNPAVPIGSVATCDALEETVAGADYVQESVLETVEVKTEVARAIDKALGPGTLVGSSSSGIPASRFTEQLVHRDRFFIVHPVNPPHLIPVVEIVPAPWSDGSHIAALRAFLSEIGQEPMVVEKEIEGFVLNRLQGALLNEAFALLADGYASAEDIDRTVSAGLGLRWSLMGPFETIDLNAPGGIADYAERLEPLYHNIARSRSTPRHWAAEAIERAKSELAVINERTSRTERTKRRDEWLLQLKSAKRAQS